MQILQEDSDRKDGIESASMDESHPYSHLILPQLFEGEDLMLPGTFQKAKFEMELGDKNRYGDVAEGLNSFVFELSDPIFTLAGSQPVTPD